VAGSSCYSVIFI